MHPVRILYKSIKGALGCQDHVLHSCSNKNAIIFVASRLDACVT